MAVPVVHSSRKVEEQQLAEQTEGHIGSNGPAAVSVIEQYDVAGGT